MKMATQRASGRMGRLGWTCATRRAQRARPRDHLVTGRAPATRAGGGAVGSPTRNALVGTGRLLRGRVGLLGTPGVQRRVRACVTTAARYAVATRASAMAAAGYRALGGQRRAAGGGEAHRATRKMALGSLVAGESTALVGDASGIRGRRRGWGSVRWCSASCVLAWRRSRGRRSERTRRKGLEVAVAASTTAARPWRRSVAGGNEGARCGGSGGEWEAQEPRRAWG